MKFITAIFLPHKYKSFYNFFALCWISCIFLTVIFLIYVILFEGYLLYNIVLVSAIHQHESAIYMSPLSWPFFPPSTHSTPLRYHRALIWAPWVMQQIPTSYPFHTWWCMFLCYSLNLSYPPLLPLCPEVCSSVSLMLPCK